MAWQDRLKNVARNLAGATGSALIDYAEEPLTKADLALQGQDDQDDAPGGSHPDTAIDNPVPDENAAEDPKSLFWDPFAIIEQLGYKERPSAVTYGTLKAMVWKTPIIHAIIQTRIQQMASFCQPAKDRYDMGYRVQLRDTKKEPSPEDKKWSQQAETMILRTGVTDNPRGRDTFEKFVRKIMWDSMVYDQFCAEIVPNKRGEPAEWYAVDASTIRLADTASTFLNEDNTEAVRYVQIYDGMIISEYTQKELCFGVRNPRTDIRLFGYGVSEIEMLMTVITAILFGWTYNQNAFCTTAGTLVATTKGLFPIEFLVGQKFQVVTPDGPQQATAIETGERAVAFTKLFNGLETRTSPEHRFRVIPRESLDGKAEWRQQKELVKGDHLLLDTGFVDPPLDPEDFLVGRTYEAERSTSHSFRVTPDLVNDLEFWEMIGFALGDGHWPITSWNLQIFPHFENDAFLFDRFASICKRHGIHMTQGLVDGHPKIMIHQKPFVSWLYDLGFQRSADGKRVPHCLFRAPAKIRGAILRGLFSADGHTRKHIMGYATPTVHATNKTFRQDILRLLWSLGVGSNEIGEGTDRHGEIDCTDVRNFVERVGYLQPYKNENLQRADKSAHRWDRVHPATSLAVARIIKDHPNFVTLKDEHINDWELIRKAARGSTHASRPRLQAAWRLVVGEEFPEELQSHHCAVDVVSQEDSVELMYDVTVFDEAHLFFGNFMAMHNSQGSSQKGVLNFKGAIPERQLKAFRRHWYQMISGVENSWRTPITNAEELQWINMQNSNRDMEYSAWFDFLIKISCALLTIDPVEINFKYGNTGQRAQMNEAANKEKITESKERGLRPLLRFLETQINQYIIWPLNEAFEFKFMGLDAKTREDMADLNTKLVKTVRTIDELRAEDNLPPLPEGKGEIILDPTWLQFASGKDQMAQQGDPNAPGGDAQPGADGQGDGMDFQQLLAEQEADEADDDDDDADQELADEQEATAKSLRLGDNLQKAKRLLVDLKL